MKKVTVLLILIIASCHYERPNDSNQKTNILVKKPNKENENTDLLECDLIDSLIVESRLEYQMKRTVEGKYEIIWGDKINKRKYSEQFECWITPNDEICDFRP